MMQAAKWRQRCGLAQSAPPERGLQRAALVMNCDFIVDREEESGRPPLSGWESVVFVLEDEPSPVRGLAELRAVIEEAERLIEAWR